MQLSVRDRVHESNNPTRFTPEPSVAGPSKPYTPPNASMTGNSSRQPTLDFYINNLRPGNLFKPALVAVHQELNSVDNLFKRLGTVEDDLALSESSDEPDDDMTNAAHDIEEEILKM